MIPTKCYMREFHERSGEEYGVFSTELESLEIDFTYMIFRFKCGHSMQISYTPTYPAGHAVLQRVTYQGHDIGYSESGPLEVKLHA